MWQQLGIEESKELHRFISLLNDPLTAGYNEYGPVVVVVAKSMLEWVSNHCQHFRSFYVIESGLKTLIKQLGGN